MDDHYRMIEQDIETLLDENHGVVTLPSNETIPEIIGPFNFLSYKNLEMAAKEGPILGQYPKWSTVESDELNVQNHSIEQRKDAFAPMLPAYVDNLTLILLNLWNAQLRQNMTMTKKGCSFCKKCGMNFATYSSHSLRVNGVLCCPVLLKCQCAYCWKSGHTMRYCPLKERAGLNISSTFVDRTSLKRY